MKCCEVICKSVIYSAIVIVILTLLFGIVALGPPSKKRLQDDLERAQIKAQILYVEAQAQRDANLLITQSLTPQILRMQAIQKWDGRLPEVIPGWRGIMPMINIDIDE